MELNSAAPLHSQQLCHRSPFSFWRLHSHVGAESGPKRCLLQASRARFQNPPFFTFFRFAQKSDSGHFCTFCSFWEAHVIQAWDHHFLARICLLRRYSGPRRPPATRNIPLLRRLLSLSGPAGRFLAVWARVAREAHNRPEWPESPFLRVSSLS